MLNNHWLNRLYRQLMTKHLRTNARRRSQPHLQSSFAEIEMLESRQMLSVAAVVAPQISVSPPNQQAISPAVATDSAGDSVIVWSATVNGGPSEIFGQRYSANGKAEGTAFVVSQGNANSFPSVAMDSKGDFVVAWESSSAIPEGPGVLEDVTSIDARRYSSSGVAQGNQFTVAQGNSLTTDFNPSLAMDSGGDFVVAWTNINDNTNSVEAQRYSSSGKVAGSVIAVAQGNATTFDFSEKAAMDAKGDFVIAWTNESVLSNGGLTNDIFSIDAQPYNSSGKAQGSELTVAKGNVNQADVTPAVAMDSNGDFVVAWTYENNSSGMDSITSVDAQRYNSSGKAQGSQMTVAQGGAINAESPAVSMDSQGDFVVTWKGSSIISVGPNVLEDVDSIDAQRYNSSGIAQGNQIMVVQGNAFVPTVAMDSKGDFVVAWMSQLESRTTDNFGISAQQFKK